MASLATPAAAGSDSAPQLLGFFATTDFNLQAQQQAAVAHQFSTGDSLTATVASLPSPATGGRLLLSVPLAAMPLKPSGRAAAKAAGGASAKGGAAGQQPVAPAAGTCVEATVSVVHPLHADLVLAGGCHGRLHVCEAAAATKGKGKKGSAAGEEASPLSGLAPGQQLQVAVLGRVATAEGRRHGLLECSSLPDAVGAAQSGKPLPRRTALSWGTLKPGQQLHG